MNSVQQKIPCVYVTGVSQEPSAKRSRQPFKVSALGELTEAAKLDDLSSALVSEKLDGTCCLVDMFQGHPILWARHDRKPSKAGERRLNQYKKLKAAQEEKEGSGIIEACQWNFETDFKEVPANWIPASRLEVRDGFVLPDSIGHTPGWVPVEVTSRQHCWHLQAVDLEQSLALVLRKSEDSPDKLILVSKSLHSLCGQTCELIGTNINGNPYGLGSKKCPFHVLVVHGSIPLHCPAPEDFSSLQSWLSSEEPSGQVEGVVWHCANGQLHKVHRHHLNLKWPVESPRLSRRPVQVSVSAGETSKEGSLFTRLASLSGLSFDHFQALQNALLEKS